jgi:hypothetical protein
MQREVQTGPLNHFRNMTKQLELRMQNAEVRLLELQQQLVTCMKMQENSDAKQVVSLTNFGSFVKTSVCEDNL